MLKHIAAAACVTLLVMLPASAQERVQITPFYGYMFPQGDLPRQFALDRAGGGSLDLFDGEFESKTPLYGATVAFGVWKWLSVEGTFVSGTDKFQAARRAENDVKILAYSGGLSVELPKQWRVEPYLLAGVGVKSYDFDIPDTKAEKDIEYNFGGGINLEIVKNLALNLQARDFVSEFSSSIYGVNNEWQNDLFIAAGLTLRFDLKREQATALTH
ncbi:MAG TPA: outer membrane beta-barrel protein [Longimicrobiales bacterium]